MTSRCRHSRGPEFARRSNMMASKTPARAPIKDPAKVRVISEMLPSLAHRKPKYPIVNVQRITRWFEVIGEDLLMLCNIANTRFCLARCR